MSIRVPAARRTSALQQILADTDGGTIEIRSGSQPANGDTAASGTLLATFTLPATGAFAVDAGVATLDADPDLETTSVAAATAGWARVKTAGGVTAFDGSVNTSGADFIINTTTITSGQTVKLTAGTLTFPA